MPHTAEIHTPVGRIVASAFVSGLETFELSVLTFAMEPDLPDGMRVDDCHAVLLDLRAKGRIRHLEFSLFLDNKKLNWGAETGEGLESYSVTENGYIVQVGTEDGDLLAERLRRKELSTRGSYPFTLSRQEMKQTLTDMDVHGRLTLHYLVAWNPDPEPEESSCWYAVDVPHSTVLESAS